MNLDVASVFASVRKVTETPFRRVKNNLGYQYRVNLPRERYATELARWYRKRTGKTLDLSNPTTFCEKIQWCKLYDSTPIKTRLADKFTVRDWVARQVGSEFLVPLLGVWDSFDAVAFDNLPDRFVLKANHGCRWNVIVEDKRRLDREKLKRQFDRWLATNYAFMLGFELQYKHIRPRIIAEKNIRGSEPLREYKVICTDGEPRVIWSDWRTEQGQSRNCYDTDWNLLPFTLTHPNFQGPDPRPGCLMTMIEVARILCQGFCQVRVDFYVSEGRVYFGEMTFTSGSGLSVIKPREWDFRLGHWVTLPPPSPIP